MLVLSALGGCSQTTTTTTSSFQTPMGLAVAAAPIEGGGYEYRRLFVSNFTEDSLQVLELGDTLADVELLYGPNNYFPLRIPAGAGPGDLAATSDGRFVVVLDLITESVRLVDAKALTLVRDAAGGILELPLGGGGARPTSLIAAPVCVAGGGCKGVCGTGCEAGLLGRFYVSMPGSASILAFDVVKDGAAGNTPPVVLKPSRIYDVGGEPTDLAVDRAGTLVFASDSAAMQVLRLDLASGLVDRRDVGGAPGPLAVTPDGTLLLVGRPEWSDLVVFDDASGSRFAPLDANPAYTPLPQCLSACAATDPAVCDGAHPADQAICSTDAGLGTTPGAATYDGLYLGRAAAKILALGEVPKAAQDAGTLPGEPWLNNGCQPPGDPEAEPPPPQEQQFSQYAVVATLDGAVLFVALRADTTAPAAPTLVTDRWCRPPSVSSKSEDRALYDEDKQWSVVPDANHPEIRHLLLASLLAPCPATPAGRQRTLCASDGRATTAADGTAIPAGGVVLFPGNHPPSITFQWEGLLTNINQAPDAGMVDDEGAFVDRVGDLDSVDIRGRELAAGFDDPTDCEVDPSAITYYGDVLQILSKPLGDSACRTALGNDTRKCRLERRIVKVDSTAEGHRRLFVCPSLLPVKSCFDNRGTIQYHLRAGDEFVVGFGANTPERLGPGEVLLPRAGIDSRNLMFQVRALDAHPGLDACERYDDAGMAQAPMEQVLSRGLKPENTTWTLDAVDELVPLETGGKGFDVNAGQPRIPGAMILSPVGEDEPVAFLTYSATNGLLGFVPSDATANRRSHRYLVCDNSGTCGN
ncbi:MAG: hypothetical protein HY903_15330 [Deltaproteobacteria bacterium]|nr:hypothetical protein [Deltaproteobacteria bacterium]